MSASQGERGSEQVKYSILLEAARGAFRSARQRVGLNGDQAFAYMYDHMELLLRSSDPWCRVAAYTAIFLVASENEVKINSGDQFGGDVLDELRNAYAKLDHLATCGMPQEELQKLTDDICRIRNEYA